MSIRRPAARPIDSRTFRCGSRGFIASKDVNTDNQVADQVTIRENKLSLVERLADDLAHEIKNPLHSMVINLEVLRRRLTRLGSEPGEELLRYAGVLSSELERVNRRVDLLLRMVRPHRDGEDPTTVAEVLEELHELVELECQRHEVTLLLEPPNVITRARLPRAPARQMILSLILKTLDSVPPGGSLEVASTVTDETIQLQFRGIGLDPDAPALPPSEEDVSYLPVARTLAETLGGQLDIAPDQSGRRSALPGSYVLTLPRDR
jgi:signal transduction histidine kinase